MSNNCIDIEYDKVLVYTEKAAKTMEELAAKGKELKFNHFQLTTNAHGDTGPALFKDLFAKVESTADTAASKIKEMITRTDLKANLATLLNNMTAERSTISLIDVNGKKTSRELVANSIGLGMILEAIENEPAIVAKHNINKTTADTTKSDGEQTTGLERLFPAIGQAVMIAQGEFMTGSKYYNIAAYVQKGREVVHGLMKDGLVVVEDGNWITQGIKPINGKFINSTVDTGKVVKINSKTITKPDEMRNALRKVSRLITAQTTLPPKTEASETNLELQDLPLDKQTKETMDNVQKGKYSIAPAARQIFEELHKLYTSTKSEKGFKRKLLEKYSMSERAFVTKVLGIDMDAKDSIFEDSKRGTEISKVNPLIALMENYDKLGSEAFYFTFFMARNSREFLNESVLNYQSDKNIARSVLAAGNEVSYNTEAEVTEFVNRIATEYGVHTDVIRGTLKGTVDLEDYITMINNGEGMDVIVDIAKNPKASGIDATNAFEQLKVIQAIIDVRLGTKSSIKSKHLTESDATASGIILKMFQNTHLPHVRETLQNMGLGKDIADGYSDAYALATKKYKEIEASVAGKSESLASKSTVAKKIKRANRLIELLDLRSFRDLIKMPIMTFSYHQEDKNNQATFGKDSTKILLEGSMDNLNAAIEEFGVTNTVDGVSVPFRKFTEASKPDIAEQAVIYDTLAPLIAQDTGMFLVEDILNPVYKEAMFEGTEKQIKIIFDKIVSMPAAKNAKGKPIDGSEENGNVVNVKFMSPLVVMNWMEENPGKEFTYDIYKSLAKYRMSADKMFETRLKMANGEKTIVKQNHANITSLYVLPIHAMDAAILLRSVRKTYEGLKDKFGKDFKDADLEAILETPFMLVHDAVSIPSKYSHLVEAAYEQEIINVSSKYDVVQMLLYEAQFRNGGVAPVDLTIESTENKKNVEAKKEFFESLKSEDGTWTTLKHSFAPDLSPEAIAKVNEEYDAKYPTEPEPTPDPETTIKSDPKPIDPNTLEISDAIETVVKEGTIEGKTVDTNPFQSIKDKLPQVVVDFFNIPGVSKFLTKSDKYSFNPVTDAIGIKPKPDADTFTTEALHHEVVHFYTSAYLLTEVSEDSNSVGYVREAMKQVLQLSKDGKIGVTAKERLDYVAKSGNERVRVAEFVAIMESEPDVAQEVYEALEANKKGGIVTKIKEAIKAIIKAAKAMIITDDHIDTMLENGADPEVLFGAIKNIMADGKKFREDVDALSKAKEELLDTNQGELFAPSWASKRETVILRGLYKDLHKGYKNEYDAIIDVINRFKECR